MKSSACTHVQRPSDFHLCHPTRSICLRLSVSGFDLLTAHHLLSQPACLLGFLKSLFPTHRNAEAYQVTFAFYCFLVLDEMNARDTSVCLVWTPRRCCSTWSRICDWSTPLHTGSTDVIGLNAPDVHGMYVVSKHFIMIHVFGQRLWVKTN